MTSDQQDQDLIDFLSQVKAKAPSRSLKAKALQPASQKREGWWVEAAAAAVILFCVLTSDPRPIQVAEPGESEPAPIIDRNPKSLMCHVDDIKKELN